MRLIELAVIYLPLKEQSVDAQRRSSVLPDPITSLGRTTLVKLADEYRIPTMYSSAGLVAIGGLLAYGPSVYDSYRRAAVYVDISKHAGRVNNESILVDEIAA